MQPEEKDQKFIEKHAFKDDCQIVDYKVTMLIAAGAAMAANCEPCLNKVVPDLLEAGVAEADIRRAVEIGQFVKDRPAAIMKEAADILTGTHLSDKPGSEGCPAQELKSQPATA
jgi:alkylhydroperoxidase/carboxymuconolactone decarboxylase family protein YurZ